MLIPIRILIAGAGDTDIARDDVYRPLDALADDYASRVPPGLASVSLTVIHQGRGTGADWLAEEWAKARNMAVWELRVPRRESVGERNRLLLDQGQPDVVLAFPGGKSTLDLVVRARQREVRVILAPLGGAMHRFGRGVRRND